MCVKGERDSIDMVVIIIEIIRTGRNAKGQGQRVVRGVENWQISPLGAVLAISFGKCAIFP